MRIATVGWRWPLSLLFLASGCGSSLPAGDCPAPRAEAGDAYTIGAGDILQITVWQNADLTSRVAVRPDGMITMPLAGEVPAAGRRPNQVQEDITRRLARYLTTPASVTVTAAEINSYRIYVLGQVTNPGELRPRAAVKVLQALALAGGVTRFADPDSIIVVRHGARGQCRLPFSMSETVEEGRLEENFILESGDTVFVE